MTANFAQAYEQFNRHATSRLPQWANALREGAYRDVMEKGFPTRRDEEWRYLNLRPLTSTEFDWDLPTEVGNQENLSARFLSGATNLVFVNGAFSPALSDPTPQTKGVSLVPLVEALERDDGSLRALLEGQDDESDVFHALKRAFVYGGIVIDLGPGAVCDKPVHLLFITTAGVKPHAAFPQVILRARPGAIADVIETHTALDQAATYLSASRTIVHVEKGANVRFALIQTETPTAFHLNETTVRVAEGATFEGFQFACGGAISRQKTSVSLEGAHATAQVDGLYLVEAETQSDQRTVVDHKVADATSRQVYKGILKGKARAIFDGKIYVRRDAQRTHAHQLNKNLLLSSAAEVDTKPQLFIDADDVKCSHGAAVGRLDKDELFYLLTRGISAPEAESLLSHAFAIDVVHRVSMPLVRESVLKSLNGFFQ